MTLLWAPEDLSLDVRTVGLINPTASQVVIGGRCWLLGFSITEMTGTAAALVELFDGVDADGAQIDLVHLAASESARWNPGTPGVPCQNGLTVAVPSGTVIAFLTIGQWVSSR